jgi:2-C-methyl-D-erythritol 2,4-cyclodiphosphate synthase
VTIPHHKGLQGHSDADVLIHSIIDALLGAIGENDIGYHFPDSNPRYKDIRSTRLLGEAFALAKKHRFSLVNIDATIIAQEPQLTGYLGQMRRSLGEVLQTSPQHVNVKATSPEGVGALGTGEGIAAIAIVTMKGPE